jgi:hypothetical protein
MDLACCTAADGFRCAQPILPTRLQDWHARLRCVDTIILRDDRLPTGLPMVGVRPVNRSGEAETGEASLKGERVVRGGAEGIRIVDPGTAANNMVSTGVAVVRAICRPLPCIAVDV